MLGIKAVRISVWVCLHNEGFRMRSELEAYLVYEALLRKQALHSSHKLLNTTEC